MQLERRLPLLPLRFSEPHSQEWRCHWPEWLCHGFSCLGGSLDDLASDGHIQLTGCVQIRANQGQIVELNAAIIGLCVEEIEKRSGAVLVREGNGVAHSQRLLEVVCLVGLQ